jgi:hypothetical protein
MMPRSSRQRTCHQCRRRATSAWRAHAAAIAWCVASATALGAQDTRVAAGPDGVTSTTRAVRAVVDAAIERNLVVRPRMATMHGETEAALLTWNASGREEVISVQQQASDLAWTRDSLLAQHITGYRAEQAGLHIAMTRAWRAGWVVPQLQGQRLRLRLPDPPGTSAVERAVEPVVRPLRRLIIAPETLLTIHPLASDAPAFYDYPALDSLLVPRDSVGAVDSARVLRLHVRPKRKVPKGTSVFEGFVDLDPATFVVERLRGRVFVVKGLFGRVVDATADQARLVGFIDFRNGERSGSVRLPAEERVDLIGGGVVGEAGTLLRFVTHFDSTVVVDGTLADRNQPFRAIAYRLTYAPMDSQSRYQAWRRDIGAEVRDGEEAPFADLYPDRLRAEGDPIWRFRARNSSDVFRFNKVEGYYTGLAAGWYARDALPGFRVRGTAGYAWSEEVARGQLSVGHRAAGYLMAATAGRVLDFTNDFKSPYDSGSTWAPMFFSSDNYDYVDRRLVSVGFERELKFGGTHVHAQVGRVRDDETVTNRRRGFFFGPFRPNRMVDSGTYTRAIIALEWNPDAQADVTREHFGGATRVEAGSGDLDYQRVEGSMIARTWVGRWELIGRAHAGVLLGHPPTQQLFELGAQQNLPGYDYKAFAGDRAWSVRGTAHYDLPLWRAPFPIIAGFVIPAIAPSLSLGLQGGMAWASDDEARAAVDRLGVEVDEETGAPVLDPDTGLPIPVSVPTTALRATTSVGVRLLSGAVYMGLAMPIDATRDTRRGLRFVVSWGRQL